jgi:hypothetical protein
MNTEHEMDKDAPPAATQSSLLGMPNKRRTAAEMATLREEIVAVLTDDHPQTCRSVFYRLVGRRAVPKTEAAYQGIVVRLLTRMRLDGAIPFTWITDGTRLRRKPNSARNMAAALERFQEGYRRDLWQDQDAYVEVWAEKDAITGVLFEETWVYDVPLMSCRGYPSVTYLHSAAEEIARQQKPAHLYYFGDHDPSGVDITRNVEARLREFAPKAEIHFERVAVTPKQIKRLHLPTRPTKTTDSRSKGFSGESVEVDAIEPKELRRILRNCITRHLSKADIEANERTEQLELESLETVLQGWREMQMEQL